MMLSTHNGNLHAQRIRANGINLAYSVFGPRDGPVVIFAHGAGQTRFAWKGAAQALGAQGYCSIVLDLRGHGESDWASDGDYSLETIGADLIDAASAFRGADARPHIVGASLGGLGAIVAAGILAPEAFATVTLVDVTPNMDPSGVAMIVGFMGAHVEEGFASLEEAAEIIAQYLPHRARPTELQGLRKNLRKGPDGRWRWHWDPALITGMLRRRSVKRVADLEQAVRDIKVPIHLVRGRMSELVSEASVAAFRKLAPAAHYTDVADARHMVAGDRNDAFTHAVAGFLRRHRQGVLS